MRRHSLLKQGSKLKLNRGMEPSKVVVLIKDEKRCNQGVTTLKKQALLRQRGYQKMPNLCKGLFLNDVTQVGGRGSSLMCDAING